MTAATDLIRPEIDALKAYHVADASGYLKLDAMENPHTLPAPMRAELGALLAEALIHRYPDPQAETVKQRLVQALDLPTEAEILLGNGSDEIIQIIAMTLARPDATLLALEPSFVMYRMIATFCGLGYVGVPLKADFALDMPATLDAIRTHRPAVTFIAYPNNPTGNRFSPEDVATLIEAAAPGLVVVDEAYHAFAADSFMPRVLNYPNVVVMRTLSKLGLAGLRLGFLVGSADWLGAFDKVRLPYNINVLTQVAASYALDHIAVFNAQAADIRAERSRLAAGLAALSGWTVYPSEANFLLARVPDAPAVFAGLKAAGILIKNLHGAHPMLDNCLRFTVGSRSDNDAVLSALAALTQGALPTVAP